MKKEKLSYWIPFIIINLIIFYFSSRTGAESNSQSDPLVFAISSKLNILSPEIVHIITLLVRKTGHFIEFLILGATCFIGVYYSFKESLKYKEIISFFISYLCAVFDEIHQLFVPGRSGQLIDTLIDGLGIISGIILISLFFKFIKFLRTKKRLN